MSRYGVCLVKPEQKKQMQSVFDVTTLLSLCNQKQTANWDRLEVLPCTSGRLIVRGLCPSYRLTPWQDTNPSHHPSRSETLQSSILYELSMEYFPQEEEEEDDTLAVHGFGCYFQFGRWCFHNYYSQLTL